MNYYEIALNDRGLKKHQSLTYSSTEELNIGDVVEVPLKSRFKNGIVLEIVKQPKYKTKPISKVITDHAVQPHLIKLVSWISNYYAVDQGTAIGLTIPGGVNKKRHQAKAIKKITSNKPLEKLPSLTKEQKNAIDTISRKNSSYLLRGITGSGKTRVYIEIAKKMRQKNLASIILVPEIGLTSQMINQFSEVFADEVFVIHSHLTEAQRHQLWNAIANSKCPIVVGPRSALFSPIKKLGLIVIDEEHETSYKQDVSPKYLSTRVASKLRELTKSTLILGSATPKVEDYFLASHRQGSIVEMMQPVNPKYQTSVKVIDIKDRSSFTSNKWLSNELISATKKALKESRQVLLFHNRRGTSTSVVCRDCGWVAQCPNCDLPLTHHEDWGKLVCHICNHREGIISVCKNCSSSQLDYKGAGTKELVEACKKLFPNARIERFDSDVIGRKNQLEQRYDDLLKGNVDIIIGTQMVAKGLDLPKLALVGVVLADTSLYLPDFSASERTYQLINQVIGRAGRHRHGTVVLQTYNPKSELIEYAIGDNWQAFYDKEMAERKLANYPPFTYLLKIVYEGKTDQEALSTSSRFAKMLIKQITDIELLGPSPAFHHKTRTGWRWQIVVKSKNRAKLTHIASNLPAKWQFDLDPINLL